MNTNTITKRLQQKKILLMDGAMGTEILNKGMATTLPLWSAEVLVTNPNIVQQIHEEYIHSGAEIIITNTFSTTRRTFEKKGIGNKAKDATILACQLAQQAREKTNSVDNVFIAGSIAPLEDCYSPELTPALEDLQSEHKEYIENLIAGGVDFLLLETMITERETLTILSLAQQKQMPVAVSFCCDDSLHLLGGESLEDMVKKVEAFNPLFIGINCVSANIATKAIKYLKTQTKRPLSVYAQGNGLPDNQQGWRFTKTRQEQSYCDYAKQWVMDGAKIIGGCCGTHPKDIQSIACLLQDKK